MTKSRPTLRAVMFVQLVSAHVVDVARLAAARPASLAASQFGSTAEARSRKGDVTTRPA